MSIKQDLSEWRAVTEQGERAMGDLAWTMRNVNWRASADRVENHLDRLAEALSEIKQISDTLLRLRATTFEFETPDIEAMIEDARNIAVRETMEKLSLMPMADVVKLIDTYIQTQGWEDD